ncbi:MAG: AMP-binding protein [Holophaga sp.]
MLERYLDRLEYSSYQDFRDHFRIRVPDSFNFAYDVVDEYARLDPGRIALVWCDEQGASATFTFAQLKEASDRTANLLRSLGIGRGDPVMLILKRRYEYWFCLLALHKLGAVAIPATHQLTPKDLVYRNNAASVKLIVATADPLVLEHVEASESRSPSLQGKVAVGGPRPGWTDFDREYALADAAFQWPEGDGAPRNDDTLLLYFTSGTTGYPKMVRHTFTYPLGHILTAAYWQRARDGGLHFTVSDTGWAKSAWGKIYGQWLAGAAVFVYDYDKFVPKDLLKVIAEYRVTTFCAPPTVYRYLIKEDLSRYDLSRLEYAVIAGEPLNPEVYNQFLRLTGLKVREGYGQTECTVAVATYPWLEPRPGSMGLPSPGYDLDVVDDAGRSCEVGEVGEIVIRTDHGVPVGMFDGYYRDPDLTAQAWHDGLYHTGDTAWRDEDGYYWFVGRKDDVIKSSGYRIGPFEVESALLEHPAVLECAVTAAPDPLRGQVVKATVVLAAGHRPSEKLVTELQEHVKEVTAPYKYPRIIEFVTELPKTISGKIRRVEIREHDRVE